MANTSFNLSALNGTNGFQINGIAAGDHTGIAVSSAGDVNGDGLDDLLIGSYGADPNNISGAGKSYVVFGRKNNISAPLNLSALNGTNGFKINGIAAGDSAGISVSSAGDINGDGIDDLIIGANGSNNKTGQSYVVYGKRSAFSSSLNLSTLNGGTNGFKINGIVAYDASGVSVSSAGDINGDGLDDLIIGAYGADPNNLDVAGQSYVVFGSRNPFNSNFNLADLNGSNGFKINGITAFDMVGKSVSGAGDINGDGLDDLIIGAYGADPNSITGAGQSYVVFGNRNPFNATLNLSDLNGSNGFKINGIAAYDYSGLSVSSAGDINGDGFDDIIIGAFSADPNNINYSGQSYVVFGHSGAFNANLNLTTLNGSNGFKINGITTFDASGRSVSHAGDINGDGLDDLIIGASEASPNSTANAGQSYVIFGSRSAFAANLNLSDLNGSNGFTINGIAPVDLAGKSVSGAGDVNGDGIDDLIIGAPSADPNGESSGQSYVIYGNAAPTLDLNGSTNGINFITNFIGAAKSIIDANLNLVDRNSPNLVGATITITNLLDGANEILSAIPTGSITTRYSNGVLTLSGLGTLAQYQQVLRSITYSNIADTPNTTNRSITFVVNDGAAHSNTSAIATTTLTIAALTGNDTISGGAGNDILNGGAGNDALNGLSGNDTLWGNSGNDILRDNLGNDSLIGGNGNDNLYAGTGNDTLVGGAGNDSYYLSYYITEIFNDTIIELTNGGTDTAYSIFNVTALANEVENLTLLGTTAVTATGNSLSNTIYGNGFNNIISGLDGNDILRDNLGNDRLVGGNGNDNLYAGVGNDTLDGGAGNDVYYFSYAAADLNNDVIIEAAGGGIDTAYAIFTVGVLANEVENLTLFGTGAIDANGNSLNNMITGNSAANKLNGGAKADILKGGLGNDTFVFEFGESGISTGVDRLLDFTIGSDKIDLFSAPIPSNFSRASDTAASNDLLAVINTVYLDANGAIAGNQALSTLGIKNAALFRVLAGSAAGTYLVIDNGATGFQTGSDLIVNITGVTGTLPGLGAITPNTFFVLDFAE